MKSLILACVAYLFVPSAHADLLKDFAERLTTVDAAGKWGEALEGVVLLKTYLETRRLHHDFLPDQIGGYVRMCRAQDRCEHPFLGPVEVYRMPDSERDLMIHVTAHAPGAPSTGNCPVSAREEPEEIELSGHKAVLLTDKGRFANAVRLCVRLTGGSVVLALPLPGNDIDNTAMPTLRPELRKIGALLDFKKLENALQNIKW